MAFINVFLLNRDVSDKIRSSSTESCFSVASKGARILPHFVGLCNCPLVVASPLIMLQKYHNYFS